MILRRKGDFTCELVGEAYVHGFMHGEYVARIPPSEEDYELFELILVIR